MCRQKSHAHKNKNQRLVSPENIHTINIKWTRQVMFRNIDIHIYACSRKEAMNLKDRGKGSAVEERRIVIQ